MEEKRNAYKILFRKLEGRNPLVDLGIDERIILKEILGKQGGSVSTHYRDRWRVLVFTIMKF
jgi:hypothetical protein